MRLADAVHFFYGYARTQSILARPSRLCACDPPGLLDRSGLMSLSEMVEIPRPFDAAQGMLQAKQDSAKCEPSEHEQCTQRHGRPSSSCPRRRASRLDC